MKNKILLSSATLIFIILLAMTANFALAATENVKVSKKGGTYNQPISVSFTIQKGYTVYYTVDNSTPTVKSLKYIKPIQMKKTTVLKYISVNRSGKKSGVNVQTYLIVSNEKIKPLAENEVCRALDMGDITLFDGRKVKCITQVGTAVEARPKVGQVIKYIINGGNPPDGQKLNYFDITIFGYKCSDVTPTLLRQNIEYFVQKADSGGDGRYIKACTDNSAYTEYKPSFITYGAIIAWMDQNKKVVAYSAVMTHEARENPEDQFKALTEGELYREEDLGDIKMPDGSVVKYVAPMNIQLVEGQGPKRLNVKFGKDQLSDVGDEIYDSCLDYDVVSTNSKAYMKVDLPHLFSKMIQWRSIYSEDQGVRCQFSSRYKRSDYAYIIVFMDKNQKIINYSFFVY